MGWRSGLPLRLSPSGMGAHVRDGFSGPGAPVCNDLGCRLKGVAARRHSPAASAGEMVFCLSFGGVRGWSPLGNSDRGRRVRVLCPEAAHWAKFSRAFGWVLHVSEDTHSSQFSRNLFEPVLFSEGVSEPAECGHASSQSTSPDAQRVLAS